MPSTKNDIHNILLTARGVSIVISLLAEFGGVNSATEIRVRLPTTTAASLLLIPLALETSSEKKYKHPRASRSLSTDAKERHVPLL